VSSLCDIEGLDPTADEITPERPLETYDRLLRALDHLVALAQRAGDDELREWAALAALDAIDLGDRLGMLADLEAERRREAVRAVADDLDRPPR
jgi:hypothetical protein